MESKVPGDLVYILGETRDELGGSEYYQMMGELGLNVPKVNTEEVIPLYKKLGEAINNGLLASAHAVSRGGIGVHLAMVAMGGEMGMEIDIKAIPRTPGLSDTRLLYSESAGRFIVTVDPTKKEKFENLFSGLKFGLAGKVTDSNIVKITGINDDVIISEEIDALKDSWLKTFGGLI
jgi:phosphoribosylformylglycinamidine synthase